MADAPRLYSDRCADERCLPMFEREYRLERAFLSIRAAKTVGTEERYAQGAFGSFPVAVFGSFRPNSGCGAAGQWPIETSHEPGTFFGHGTTRVGWSLDLPEGRLAGFFTVTVDEDAAPGCGDAACMLTTPDGQAIDVATPLPPVVLAPLSPTGIRLAIRRINDEADRAKTEIVRLTDGLLKKVVGRLRGSFTSQLDADDAHQLASIELMRLIEKFASTERPHVSWARYVALYTNRAVVRALEQERGIGRPELAMRRLMEERPDLAGASVDELRVELEKRTSEAMEWSDHRIALAASGPTRSVSLDEIGYDSGRYWPAAEAGVDLPPELLVEAFSDNERFLRAARPYLASEAILPGGDGPQPSDRTIRRSRRAVIAEAGRVLGVPNATTARELVEAHALEGESYERIEDRLRMEDRARKALLAVMEKSS